jgi:hypothetical protein
VKNVPVLHKCTRIAQKKSAGCSLITFAVGVVGLPMFSSGVQDLFSPVIFIPLYALSSFCMSVILSRF